MDEALRQIQANIAKMIDGGATARQVDAYLRDEGFTREEWLNATASPGSGPPAMEPVPAPQSNRYLSPIGSSGDKMVNPLGVARSMLQGLPLVGEFSDEVLGDTRQVEEMRASNPIASTAGEIAGGVAAPVGGALAIMKNAKWPARIAAGALAGMAGGAVEGAGRAEGGAGQRITSTEARIGAALGLGGGLAGATLLERGLAARRARGLPGRANAALAETAGVPGRTASRAFASEVADQRTQLSSVYEGLANEYPRMDDPRVMELMAELRRDFPYHVRELKLAPDQAPSFDQLKRLRTALSELPEGSAPARVLSDILDDTTAGASAYGINADGFSDLTRRYAANRDLSEAFDNGRSAWNRAAYEIENEMSALRGAPEKQAYRVGRVSRIMEGIGRREETAVAQLRRFMDAGPDEREAIRLMFPEGEIGAMRFGQFMEFLKRESDVASIDDAFRKWTNRAGAVGGAYGLYKLGYRPGDN